MLWSVEHITACFCVIAVSFTRLEGYAAILFLGAVVLLTLRLLRNLGFFEIDDAPLPSSPEAGESRIQEEAR